MCSHNVLCCRLYHNIVARRNVQPHVLDTQKTIASRNMHIIYLYSDFKRTGSTRKVNESPSRGSILMGESEPFSTILI